MKLYRTILDEQADQFMIGRKILPIPQRDIQCVSRFTNNYLWDYCRDLNKISTFKLHGRDIRNNCPWYLEEYDNEISLIPFDKNIGRNISIIYLEDEYYLAKMIFGFSSMLLFFKCDSIDGLMEFVSDLNNGII